jgi:NADH dehydrogenase FAD-containing subunit
MRRHLLLAGSGHSHLELLSHLDEYVGRGCDVTLVSPDVFWYSGMGPGVLSETYLSEEHRVDTAKLVTHNGGCFVRDLILRIDAPAKTVILHSGQTLSYDLLSLNIGSAVPTSAIDGADQYGWPVKPIANLTQLHDAVCRQAAHGGRIRLVVAGGGAAGCEVAINLWRLLNNQGAQPSIRIVSAGAALMESEGPGPGQKVAQELARLGVDVILGRKVVRAAQKEVCLDEGSVLASDFFIVATGVRPPSLFYESGLPTASDGSLLVNRYLQSVAAPQIFGAGDCIGFEDGVLPRVGVYAVRESKILRYNLRASLDRRRLRPFKPQRSYLLILNLGDGSGLFCWRGYAWRGRWAFRLKNFLDCGFVGKYRPK